MCPFILDLKCQACFFTDWRQISNHAGYLSLCMKRQVMVYPKFLGHEVTGPLPINGSWEVHSNPTQRSAVKRPLHSPAPSRSTSARSGIFSSSVPFFQVAVKRNMSCILWGWCHRPLCTPNGAGEESGSQRCLESATLNPVSENYAPVFKPSCSWCFCCHRKSSSNFLFF